jgi:Superinfection immunity protein
MTPEVAFLIALYFLPAIIATVRQHPNQNPIFILTLLLGWTVIGWIVALIWSSTFIASEGKS